MLVLGKLKIEKKLDADLRCHQATRHSFVSPSLDQVSAAVGHSSPLVTRRYYDHFVRRSFSGTLRAGLTKPGPANPEPMANVIPIGRGRQARRAGAR